MCGINGFCSQESLVDAEVRLSRMNDSLTHRGPDASGSLVCSNGRVGLGHRRLSIIDTQERSNQPMRSVSGKWTIVFNGEIYNFLELKQKTTYPFKTNSDTETILAYVEEFGLDQFLVDCNGMFALCLYNHDENYMLLARDRMGIKPLYYYVDSNKFIFSSEIKGVLQSGLVDAKLNEAAIDEYLGNRYIRAPYTFFSGIYQLEPGHKLRIDIKKLSAGVEKRLFWKLPSEFNMRTNANEKEVLEEFSEEFTEAVRRRMIADVPLGTYLSGGVDSSLISALTTKIAGHSINTFTIGFPELNEFDYAKLVADEYNTNHHQILMDHSNYFDNMREVISFKDAPLGVPNEIPLAIMSTELKKKITVVLSGEGADELLGGYGRIYRSAFDYAHHNIDTSFYDYFIGLYEYVPRELRDKFLTTGTELREYFDDTARDLFSNSKNEESIFRFFHSYHVQGLLQRVDTTTMLAAVEARVPFLDHKLVEFSYKSIPYDFKLRWKDKDSEVRAAEIFSNNYSEILDIPKYLLRQLAYQYLPKEVIERKKVGFPVPLNEWMKQLESLARTTLHGAYWLKRELLEELIVDCHKNSRSGQILWMFINFEVFRSMYFDRDWRY